MKPEAIDNEMREELPDHAPTTKAIHLKLQICLGGVDDDICGSWIDNTSSRDRGSILIKTQYCHYSPDAPSSDAQEEEEDATDREGTK